MAPQAAGDFRESPVAGSGSRKEDRAMRGLCVITSLLVGAAMVVANQVRAEQQQIPTGCAQIMAVLDQSGGALSAEEVAKKTSTDVETVRSCTDLWRHSMKKLQAPKGANAAQQAVPEGCAQIVAVLDQSGGALSAEEVAKKTSTDVETVRNCTDFWRHTMKGGAHP
jgi:hypothetical protein